MPNLQPLIDNAHLILAGFGLVLWAAAQFAAKKAANPEKDRWDDLAPRLQWASSLYSQAIDWLCTSGVLNLKGAEKLAELNRLVKAFEGKLSSGDYLGAINDVIGYYTAAKNKSFFPLKGGPNPPTIPSNPAATPIGPDDVAQP